MRNFTRILLALFLFSILQARAEANETALTSAKKLIKKAQIAWDTKKPLENDTLEETKKGAYCAMGEDSIDFEFVSSSMFGRIYTKADGDQQLAIREALLNNYAQVFLNQIGYKINYTYDWEKAQIENKKFGRGRDRVEGISIKVITWKPEYDKLPEDSRPTSYVIFELFDSPTTPGTYYVADIVLAGIRVSELYKSWVKNIRLKRTTLEKVLKDWAAENTPLCPEDTDPYRKLFN